VGDPEEEERRGNEDGERVKKGALRRGSPHA